MEDHAPASMSRTPAPPAVIEIAGTWSWEALLRPPCSDALGRALAERIAAKRWFGAKAKTIRRVAVMDSFPLSDEVRVVLVEIHFADGPSDIYQVPLAFAAGDKAERALAGDPSSVWAQVHTVGQRQPAVLLDAVVDEGCCTALVRLFDDAQPVPAGAGQVVVHRASAYGSIRGGRNAPLQPRLVEGEQSNTSIRYGDRLILKLYRRIETGVNPDWELNAFLAEHHFDRIPPLGGAIEYRQPGQAPWTLALLQGLVKIQGDAWQYTLQQLRGELQRVAGSAAGIIPINADLVDAASRPFPPGVERALGHFFQGSRRLGQRTAEMHLALASETRDPDFAPQPVSAADQRAWAERARELAEQTFALLGNQRPNLPDDVAHMGDKVLQASADVDKALGDLAHRPLEAMRIRIHGDYHLGQVLVTDDDFVILDFEGEPARPLAERREKQLALRDVAGMIRSFHYASRTAATDARALHLAAAAQVDEWTAAWCFWTSAAFLAGYRQTAGGAAFLPRSIDQFRRLLRACLLEKAIYELRYELNNRPTWVYLPLEALADLLVPQQPRRPG